MNCLEFRRLLESGSGAAGTAARAHAAECPSCAEFERRMARFDAKLRDATRVPVPDNLEARILMRQSFGVPRTRHRWHRAWPALAAGLVLILAGAMYAGRIVHQEGALHTELVSLVEAADYALQAGGPVAAVAVDDALRPVGLNLREALDNVSFAGRCLVRGNLSGHLVLRDATSPVSVFLMPGEHVPRTSRFEREHWQGVLVPTGQGTVGVVVPRGAEPDPALVERVVRAVRWPA